MSRQKTIFSSLPTGSAQLEQKFWKMKKKKSPSTAFWKWCYLQTSQNDWRYLDLFFKKKREKIGARIMRNSFNGCTKCINDNKVWAVAMLFAIIMLHGGMLHRLQRSTFRHPRASINVIATNSTCNTNFWVIAWRKCQLFCCLLLCAQCGVHACDNEQSHSETNCFHKRGVPSSNPKPNNRWFAKNSP